MRYWIETLGCPKNHVDSEKLAGMLVSQGYDAAVSASEADLVVANTCAFIEAAREESIETVLELADVKRPAARLVVTGCMAERYGDELAAALPEVDLVAGFGESLTSNVASTPVSLRGRPTTEFDLLNLPRPATTAPWAYVKIAEGCDRRCGFCAIPSFRGDQRSRSTQDIVDEARALVAGGVKEIVLIAQDLASWGHDRRRGALGEAVEVLDEGGTQPLIELTRALSSEVERVRLLYLYPSGLTAGLIDAILSTGVPYFDLSLQHSSRPLLRAMRRWGKANVFSSASVPFARRTPTRRFVHLSFWATPARPRMINVICSSSSRRPNSIGPASSPSLTKTGRSRTSWATTYPTSWRSSACARSLSCKTPLLRPSRRRGGDESTSVDRCAGRGS